jgi:aspartate racemase
MSEVLGIIGGAGVGAAARLYEDVSAAYRHAHGGLPAIALWNLPFTDAIEQAFVAAQADEAAIREAEGLVGEAVDRLGAAGATVIAMPCNALQRVAAREADRAGIPFIHMIEAAIADVRDRGADAAVLLATPTTYATGIYEGYGVELEVPAAEVRAELGPLIAQAVEGTPLAPSDLERVVAHARKPPLPVIIGCTDVCGVISAPDVIDSLGSLTARCVERLGAAATA